MPSKKQKKQILKNYYLTTISKMVDEQKDIIEIARITGLPIMRVATYCALLRKIPGIGEVDLNWYINGFALEVAKRKEKKEEKKNNRMFRDNDEWFQNL